jgi:iron complex transport system ATP-binding protein
VTAVLEAAGVDFAYGAGRPGRAPFAIRDLTFTVAPGEVLGVIGPNGSGKTTLIRLLSRVLRPARGDIRLEGASLAGVSRAALARAVAVVPQDVPAGFAFTVRELVLMGRFPHGPGRFLETARDRAAAERAMRDLGVAALASEPLDRLSGGERQRALLARAVCQEPRVLVLDEPTAHLDLRHQAECVGLLRRLNREAGLTVVLVSHDLSLAGQVADRLLLLREGRLAGLGPPDAVLEERLLAAVYGCPVVVDKHPVSGRPVVQVAWPGPERR